MIPKETIPLKDRLVRYFKKQHSTWIPSGEIQRLVATYTTQTPRTCVRRLQELHEAGILERKLVKRHSHYRMAEKIDWKEHNKIMIPLWNALK